MTTASGNSNPAYFIHYNADGTINRIAWSTVAAMANYARRFGYRVAGIAYVKDSTGERFTISGTKYGRLMADATQEYYRAIQPTHTGSMHHAATLAYNAYLIAADDDQRRYANEVMSAALTPAN